MDVISARIPATKYLLLPLKARTEKPSLFFFSPSNIYDIYRSVKFLRTLFIIQEHTVYRFWFKKKKSPVVIYLTNMVFLQRSKLQADVAAMFVID